MVNWPVLIFFGTISNISGSNETYNPPEPWLASTNNKTASGFCESTINTSYSSVECVLSGLINGNLETKIVSGIMTGILKSINNEIPVTGIVSGELESEEHWKYISNNILTKIDKIYGYVFNATEAVVTKPHVLDIKDYNTLGRKGLSLENPLLGYNLHKTSNNLDERNQYAKEYWKIIEYSIDEYKSTEEYKSSKELQLKPKLATPTYLNSLYAAPFNFDEETTVKKFMEPIIYYCYLNNNKINIKKYYNFEILVEDNILFGPINSYDECILLIHNYANINNYNLTKINDFEFAVSNNDNTI